MPPLLASRRVLVLGYRQQLPLLLLRVRPPRFSSPLSSLARAHAACSGGHQPQLLHRQLSSSIEQAAPPLVANGLEMTSLFVPSLDGKHRLHVKRVRLFNVRYPIHPHTELTGGNGTPNTSAGLIVGRMMHLSANSLKTPDPSRPGDDRRPHRERARVRAIPRRLVGRPRLLLHEVPTVRIDWPELDVVAAL